MRLYRNDDHLPECYGRNEKGEVVPQPCIIDPKTKRVLQGCPVEDLATDAELSEQVERFLTAKTLYGVTEDPRTQQKTFEDLGFYEDPQLHLRCEQVHSQWMQIQRSQRRQH